MINFRKPHEHILINEIKRFDNKYFNCAKSNLISFLKQEGLPVEALLYRSFEHSENIYKQFFIENRLKRQFEVSACPRDEMEKIGVLFKEKRADRFEDLIQIIFESLTNNKIVFISLDIFYLPHKSKQFMQDHSTHWVIIAGYASNGTETQLYILDDNSSAMGDYQGFYYSLELIREAYDSTERHDGWMYMYQIDLYKYESESVQPIFMAKYDEWLRGFNDDFSFYSQVKDIYRGEDPNHSSHEVAVNQLFQAFTLISGSRSMYSLFHSCFGNNNIATLASRSAKISETITYMLYRYLLNGQDILLKLEQACDELINIDSEILCIGS